MDIMDAKIIADTHEDLLTEPAKVVRGTVMHEALQVLLDNPYTRKLYVVDGDGVLLGTISYVHLMRASSARFKVRTDGFRSFIRYLQDMIMDDVSKLMKKSTPVRKDETLKDALRIMLQSGQTDLPVIDEEGRLLGELRGMEIMRLGLEIVRQGDKAGLERLRALRREKGIHPPVIDPVTLQPKSD